MARRPRSINDLKAPPKVENCYVVSGPPGSGKTTWAAKHAGSAPVWDMDAEAARLGYAPRYPRPPGQLADLMNRRAEFIKKHRGQPMVIIITSRLEAEQVAKRIGAAIVWLGKRAPNLRPKKRSNNGRYGRKHRKFREYLLGEHIRLCAEWNDHPCYDCNSEPGQGFRLGVELELHHIRRIEDAPELQYEPSNVMWLCKHHHSIRTARGE